MAEHPPLTTMRRSVVVALCLVIVAGLSGVARAAVPSEVPADTHQVNGRVRSVVVVGDRVWMGGVFTQVQSGNGAMVQSVTNLAVLGRSTGAPVGITPLKLGGSGSQVWKLAVSGNTVYAAGKFTLSSGGATYKNLLAFNGTTGALISSFRPNVPNATAVAVSGSTVYVGRNKLQAVDAGTGANKGSFATSTVATNPSLRGHNTPPQHREFVLVGGWLYSACQCDSLTQGGSTRGVKSLVRFNPTTGAHDPGFTPAGAGVAATGISVATDGTNLYLGAGGSDYVARYAPSGAQAWKRDTSGSAQAVVVSGGDLLVGGHFVEIADAAGDGCGFKSGNPGTLDPNNQCQTRNRLAAYSLGGGLLGWNPSVTGNYNGVWGIALDGSSIHIGGEFRNVHGIRQTYYARLD